MYNFNNIASLILFLVILPIILIDMCFRARANRKSRGEEVIDQSKRMPDTIPEEAFEVKEKPEKPEPDPDSVWKDLRSGSTTTHNQAE